MLTKAQRIYIKRLQRQARMADDAYRQVIATVTGWSNCRSCTDERLTNAHADQIIAAMKARSTPTDLDVQLRQQRQPKHRLQHRMAEIQACLGLYMEDVAGYVATIAASRFRNIEGGSFTLDDLSDHPNARVIKGELVELPSDAMQFIMTLWSRLQEFRRQAGHSLHDMRTLAGMPCECAQCRRPVTLADVAPELATHPF